jgi:hypothetical protein
LSRWLGPGGIFCIFLKEQHGQLCLGGKFRLVGDWLGGDVPAPLAEQFGEPVVDFGKEARNGARPRR